MAVRNIGPRSWQYGPRFARSLLPRPRANIHQYGPRARLVGGYYCMVLSKNKPLLKPNTSDDLPSEFFVQSGWATSEADSIWSSVVRTIHNKKWCVSISLPCEINLPLTVQLMFILFIVSGMRGVYYILLTWPSWKKIQILTEAPSSTWAKMSKDHIVYTVRAFHFSSTWCSYKVVL